MFHNTHPFQQLAEKEDNSEALFVHQMDAVVTKQSQNLGQKK